MILSMQQNPPRFRYYVLFFPRKSESHLENRFLQNFCGQRDPIVAAFNNDIIILACENIIAGILEHFRKRWTGQSCGVQVQERRFRIVRPTGNPDEPLRFRHASPQCEELRVLDRLALTLSCRKT